MTDNLTTPATSSNSWRVVDIVVAAVLGVACGLIFFVWNTVGYAWFGAMDALTPGLGGLAMGVWFLGGTLGILIIRKPGAALFVELLAAIVSALIGNIWGIETLYAGIAQGLGVELVYLATRYRSYKMVTSMLAGGAAGVGIWTLELITSSALQKGIPYLVIYLVSNVISGLILGGLLAWLLARALAKTGVLSRFASGRAAE